jgi:hypothetical protein
MTDRAFPYFSIISNNSNNNNTVPDPETRRTKTPVPL